MFNKTKLSRGSPCKVSATNEVGVIFIAISGVIVLTVTPSSTVTRKTLLSPPAGVYPPGHVLVVPESSALIAVAVLA